MLRVSGVRDDERLQLIDQQDRDGARSPDRVYRRMDIEQFYDADPRRRRSEEEQFGRDWTASDGVSWEVNWVADTGEVYAMRELVEPGGMDPVGDTWVQELPVDAVTVEIIGVVTDRGALESALEGWKDAMGGPDSLEWVRDRISAIDR